MSEQQYNLYDTSDRLQKQSDNETKMPNYSELTENIKEGLTNMSRLIFRRSLFGLLPGLLIFLPLLLLYLIFHFELASQDLIETFVEDIRFFYALIVTFLFAFIYFLCINHLLFIEKIIWIDSYFDKRILGPNNTLKIAKKLFVETFKFRIAIFFKYYFLPTLIFAVLLAGLVIYINMIGNPNSTFNSPNALKYGFYSLATFAIGSLLLGFYSFYYLRIKLRYIWFLFFDNFGKENFSTGQLFHEMKNLNEVNKNETFRKLLVTDLGTDFVSDMTKSSVGMLFRGGIKKGGAAGLGSQLLSGYASGIATEYGTYGKIIAAYIFYRYARFHLYGESQTVNKNIYSLI